MMELDPRFSTQNEDHEALQQAWHALLSAAQHSSTGTDDTAGPANGAHLDYVQYCQAAEGCAPQLAGHLSASAFLRFRRGPGGTVSLAAVHTYLTRRAAMLELWHHLAAFDEAGGCALTTEQLAACIASLATQLPALQDLERHLPPPLYAAVAARKLLFFHGRAGRVRIRDLVLSPVLAELLQLPAPAPPHPAAPQGVPDGDPVEAVVAHEDGVEDGDEDGSWFAPGTAARLWGLFQGLAGDRNFLLPDDLVRFSGGNLTALFATRVFEEHATASSTTGGSAVEYAGQTYAAEAVPSSAAQDQAAPAPAAGMDLTNFLDFLLAWEHRGTAQGLRYFWAVLDSRRQGHLGKTDVAAWFREVHGLWLARGLYTELRIADVVQEVFDMAAPAGAQRITLMDLQRCGAGGNIVGMLADVAAFWEHDSKEMLLAAEADAAVPPGVAEEPAWPTLEAARELDAVRDVLGDA